MKEVLVEYIIKFIKEMDARDWKYGLV